jgi:hypothetical protein
LAKLYAPGVPLNGAEIRSALAILDRVGAHAYAEEMAGVYYRQAAQDLEQTGIGNSAQSHLRELGASLLGRMV